LADTTDLALSLPDTVWAVPLGDRITTLATAVAERDRLQAEGVVAFARVRASSTAYWYELFVGPTATRAEVDSLRATVGRLGWYESEEPVRTYRLDLMLGAVAQPDSTNRRRPGTVPDSGPNANSQQKP
jgi:hypothetical protein